MHTIQTLSQKIRFTFLLTIQLPLTLSLLLLSGCPNPPQPPPARATLPLIIGMEYAMHGLASEFTELRNPGVKFLPDLYRWDRMQSSPAAPINFATLDRFVKEYQEAGFTEAMIALKSQCAWGSIAPTALLPDTNFAPKPEYLPLYAAWVKAVVERYDHDGIADMPGLRIPIRYYEIGVEFSSYEPGPVQDYLTALEAAYAAAHEAFPQVLIHHAAFLTTNAFLQSPAPENYPQSFAAVDPRIMYHALDDIRAILDHPEWFDGLNFHALGAAEEIEPTVAWLNYEMAQRGYEKPILISDTAASPLIGWGAATTCNGTPSEGVILPPATEDDRCRLADYFSNLIDGDAQTLAWTRAFLAGDMLKKTVIAGEQGIAFINTAFMDDSGLFQIPAFQAAAGAGAWGGMALTRFQWMTQAYSIEKHYPLFYAMKQLMNWMDGYDAISRETSQETNIRLYRLDSSTAPSAWIAWLQPDSLYLPGDPQPETTIAFPASNPQVQVEYMIQDQGQTLPEIQVLPVINGHAQLNLTPAPISITPLP